MNTEVMRETVHSPVERRILGQHEMVTMPINEFVALPQVRSGLNPELANLKKSIGANGLINPIDVARMEESELRTYIDFVCRIWNADVSFDDYEHLRQDDGLFYMVIAGHSRAEAIRQLEQESDGGQFEVVAKVHDATSPEHIIELQLSENIHSTPPQERRAIGIVETFLWGQENGSWKNKKQFIEKKSGVSLDILNEALGFAELPPKQETSCSPAYYRMERLLSLVRVLPQLAAMLNSNLAATKSRDRTGKKISTLRPLTATR